MSCFPTQIHANLDFIFMDLSARMLTNKNGKQDSEEDLSINQMEIECLVGILMCDDRLDMWFLINSRCLY